MADGKSPPQREQKERMERELTWNGIPISFLHKSEPYKYLGVELRFDLSAVDHESSIRRQIIHALTCLDDCFLYQKDIWHIATTRLAPKAQYALSLGLYYESHIEKLQSLLLGCVRSSLGLLHSTSTAMVTFPERVNCLGEPDLKRFACVEVAEGLRNAIRDTGRLGRLSRQIFTTHASRGDFQLIGRAARRVLRDSLICRSVRLVRDNGLDLPFEGSAVMGLKSLKGDRSH